MGQSRRKRGLPGLRECLPAGQGYANFERVPLVGWLTRTGCQSPTRPMRRLVQSGTAGVLSREFVTLKALQLSPSFPGAPQARVRA